MTRPAAAALSLMLLAGCGFSTRKHESEALVHAARRLEEAHTSNGTIAVSVRAPKRTQGLATLPFQGTISVPALPMQLAYDERSAASKGATGTGGSIPESVYLGSVVFMKRPVRPGDLESQFGFRAWSRLDFATLKRKDKNTLGTVNIVNPINPTYLVRLLAGTLSGSVRKLGTAPVAGTPTTHYRMNVDRKKAFNRMGDRDRQAIDKAFSSNNIKGDVYKNAEAWLDGDGRPLRLQLTLKQKFTIRAARDIAADLVFPITYTIELADFGTPVTITAPPADAVARVSSLNALLEGTQAQ